MPEKQEEVSPVKYKAHLLQMLSPLAQMHGHPECSVTLWGGTCHPSAPGWAKHMLPPPQESNRIFGIGDK